MPRTKDRAGPIPDAGGFWRRRFVLRGTGAIGPCSGSQTENLPRHLGSWAPASPGFKAALLTLLTVRASPCAVSPCFTGRWPRRTRRPWGLRPPPVPPPPHFCTTSGECPLLWGSGGEGGVPGRASSAPLGSSASQEDMLRPHLGVCEQPDEDDPQEGNWTSQRRRLKGEQHGGWGRHQQSAVWVLHRTNG